MGAGLGIVLILIGAILKFAVVDAFPGVDLQTVGLICMLVGAIALAFALAQTFGRRRTEVRQVVERRDSTVAAPPEKPLR